MPGDERWALLERLEGGGERFVAGLDGGEEAIVRRALLRRLPDALDAVELGRVRRQPLELDAMAIRREPLLPFLVEVMAGAVVDDQEDLASSAMNEPFEELEERALVEDRRELILEARPALDRDRAEDVGGLAQAVRVDAWLSADRRPGPVQAAVEPEAGFVLERYDAATGCSFFLIAGKVRRSQTACFFRSARARRLRGRCTEKPSSCSSRGTWWL